VATTGTKVPSIYKVPSKADPELKLFANSVKEALEVRLGRRGDPRDRAITLRDLIESGMAKQLLSNPFNPDAGVGTIDFEPQTITDYTIPPAPTGFTVAATYTAFVLAWDPIQLGNTYFAYTEVWRNGSDDINTAARVDTTSAAVWSESAGYDTTYYYWVRHVSTSGIEGPFTGPKSGTTSVDISAVMEELSQTLANLPGYGTLINTSVPNLIATAKAEAIAGGSYIIRAASAPTTRDDSGTTALQQYDIWVDTDDNNQMYVRNAANNAWVEARDGTLVTLVDAHAVTIGGHTTSIATANTNIATVTTAQTATSTAVTNLTATVDTKTKTFAQDTAPTSTAVGDLWIDTNDNNKIYRAAAVGADEVAAGEWVALPPSTLKTFAQDAVPTSVNVGDLWIDTNDSNKMYRANAVGVSAVVTTGNGWYLLDDARITTTSDALTSLTATVTGSGGHASQLTSLNSTITVKNQTFVATSEPNAQAIGDLWVDSNDGNKLYRATATGTGDWVLVGADTNTTFAQNGAPSSGLITGDLWVDTDSTPANKLYRWDGDSWEPIEDARLTSNASAVSNLSTAVGLSGSSATKITALESTVNNATTGVAANAGAVSTLNTSVTTKSGTYVQTSAPADSPAGTLKDGDLWVNTTNSGNALSTWNDSTNAWYLIRDANIATAQTTATNAATAATNAATAASNAATAASNAQGTANTATTSLADIADDDKLTPAEKLQAKTLWDAVATEYSGIVASASNASVSSSTYVTKYNALNTYLNTTPDVFDSFTTTTTIARATWNTRWSEYYGAKQALLDAIAAALKVIADAAVSDASDAQDTADAKAQTFVQDGEPADNGANNLGEGDIWIDTNSDPVNQLYAWNNTSNAWDLRRDGMVTASANSITGINTSITNLQNHEGKTFVQAGVPNGGSVVVKAGDLWIDTDSSPANQVYRATADNAAAIVTSGNGWLLTDIQGTTASVGTISTAVSTLEGDAAAAYVLQVNVNGSVAGMVIENNASSSGDNSGSAIQFRADKFAIWNATGSTAGSAGVAPFIVDSGVVYIDTARIKDASITSAKIGSLSATLVNAVDINAGSIDSGTLSADRISTNSITTDKLAFGSGTVVTSSGSGANAILTIANDGVILDHISPYTVGKVANVVVNSVARTNSTYTFSSLYYQASTPWSEFTTQGKGGGQTSYLGNSSSPIASLTVSRNTILESGDYLMMSMIQPYGTIANNSASNESALLVQVYRSTNGSSWSYWTAIATGTRSGGQGFHLSPLVKYAVFDLSTSYHYRFDLWFHLRGFSNAGSSYGAGEGAVSIFRVNRAGGID
jgi:hypothetical protein